MAWPAPGSKLGQLCSFRNVSSSTCGGFENNVTKSSETSLGGQ